MTAIRILHTQIEDEIH